jgi:hypothetical protein
VTAFPAFLVTDSHRGIAGLLDLLGHLHQLIGALRHRHADLVEDRLVVEHADGLHLTRDAVDPAVDGHLLLGEVEDLPSVLLIGVGEVVEETGLGKLAAEVGTGAPVEDVRALTGT